MNTPNKLTPTSQQMMEYRQMMAEEKIDIEKVNAFKEKYDTYNRIVEVDGKFGIKDAMGTTLVPAEYDYAGPAFEDYYRNSVVAVSKNGKMALVSPDGKGTPVTGFIYDNIEFDGLYYQLHKDGKVGLATSRGDVVIPVDMDGLDTCFGSLVSYTKDEKFGFAMVYSDLFTETIFDSGEILDGGDLQVTKDGKIGYINDKGQFTIDPDESYFSIDIY